MYQCLGAHIQPILSHSAFIFFFLMALVTDTALLHLGLCLLMISEICTSFLTQAQFGDTCSLGIEVFITFVRGYNPQ